jgi:hypothetical protein
MKYAAEMGSVVLTCPSMFIKIGSGIQKGNRGNKGNRMSMEIAQAYFNFSKYGQ